MDDPIALKIEMRDDSDAQETGRDIAPLWGQSFRELKEQDEDDVAGMHWFSVDQYEVPRLASLVGSS